uniref:Lipoprotein n=1 Tax=Candidatus Kentrum sp. LFY TaxID=2126342 RepID=A0A450WMK0_9GAMM|nr:MAG: hypothetical protein BECKLFY1418C_GA0070996_10408 [Candidatus Kentron sp. LFY]
MKKGFVFSMIAAISIFTLACSDQGENMLGEKFDTNKEEYPIEIIVDITKIAGKSKHQVDELLGKHTTCENIKYGEKCYYEKGKTEIVFIDGKADWITVNDMGYAPYSSKALEYLGISQRKPYFESKENGIRWNNIHGLREVLISPSGSYIFYAYIKAYTK